jgi:hypothetical protein
MTTLDALLLCDTANRDAQTGKWTLTGVFDAVWAERFPAVHQSMDVYFRLRATGAPAVQLSCRTPADETHLLATLAVTTPPRGLAEGAVRVLGFQLPVPGEYRFELQVDGRVAGATTLVVAELPPASGARH